jgi:hypothetical protein
VAVEKLVFRELPHHPATAKRLRYQLDIYARYGGGAPIAMIMAPAGPAGTPELRQLGECNQPRDMAPSSAISS